MWPGRARSDGRVAGSIAVSTVAARSPAEMPVVVRCFASIGTQNAVSKRELFWDTISGTSSSSSRSGVIDRQMRPRPWRAMKLIASGVTLSAAIVRSPSFSRSSSSTTMTIRPARISAMASSMDEKGPDGRAAPSGNDRVFRFFGLTVQPHAARRRATDPPALRLVHDVLADEIALEVDSVASPECLQVRMLDRIRNRLHVEPAGPEGRDGQADAVHRD